MGDDGEKGLKGRRGPQGELGPKGQRGPIGDIGEKVRLGLVKELQCISGLFRVGTGSTRSKRRERREWNHWRYWDKGKIYFGYSRLAICANSIT